MANYYGYTRTNYFEVTDPDKLRDIVNRINWDCDDNFFDEDHGSFAFGCYGTICGLFGSEDADNDDSDDEYEAEAVYEALQKIVAPDSAIIITEVGYEKLRYLVGCAVIITHNAIEYEDIHDQSLKTARRLLGNPNFTTDNFS